MEGEPKVSSLRLQADTVIVNTSVRGQEIIQQECQKIQTQWENIRDELSQVILTEAQ